MGTSFKRSLTSSEHKTLNLLVEEFGCESCHNTAHFLREHFSTYRRGVSPSSRSTIFGNDGFEADLRSQVEVCKVYEGLKERGIHVTGLGLDPDRVTWALEMEFDDHELLHDLVWSSWNEACEEVLEPNLERGVV